MTASARMKRAAASKLYALCVTQLISNDEKGDGPRLYFPANTSYKVYLKPIAANSDATRAL